MSYCCTNCLRVLLPFVLLLFESRMGGWGLGLPQATQYTLSIRRLACNAAILILNIFRNFYFYFFYLCIHLVVVIFILIYFILISSMPLLALPKCPKGITFSELN